MDKSIFNISPIDGRYNKKTNSLNTLFSEYAFFKQRVIIEIKYFIFLLKLDTENFKYDKELEDYMNEIGQNIKQNDIFEIKEIEKRIHHDVKSIEYFLAKKLLKKYHKYINLLHFGLTSQDVNTMAYSLSLKNFNEQIFYKHFNWLLDLLQHKIKIWDKTVIVGRTHGQPATWTLLGKEFNVFYTKLLREKENLENYKFTTKLGGAVGNMTSHKLFCNRDWDSLLNKFTEMFELKRSPITTQIHNYNEYAQYFDILKRICGILIDMCKDIWLYCSFGELSLNKPKTHVGSSIMPHKVNPIEFENAEGNLKISEMWLEFLSRELIKSRMQRDLTDSTILRNLGTVFGHILIGITNINIGFTYLISNDKIIESSLLKNVGSMSEIDQHLLRKENKVNGYKTIKKENNIEKSLDVVNYYKNYIL